MINLSYTLSTLLKNSFEINILDQLFNVYLPKKNIFIKKKQKKNTLYLIFNVYFKPWARS